MASSSGVDGTSVLAKTISRRNLLKAAVAASTVIAVPTIIPASALGKEGDKPAPSNRITLGSIGVGGQGGGLLRNFLGQPDAQVLAVCDTDSQKLAGAKRSVDEKNSNTNCMATGDFRELLARKDIDAVVIATPDHWHAVIAVAAARAGKDMYCEKPVAHNWREGKAMVDAVKKYGRVFQVGSMQRSTANFRFASELVRNGRIGKVTHVEVGLPDHAPGGSMEFTAPPPELDYDMWVGPAPFAPYSKDRTHWNWRWQLDYGGGQLMDWIGHHLDIAHWGLGYDYTGPCEVRGVGEYPTDGLWDAPGKYKVETKYKTGVTMTIAGGYKEIRKGTKWIGTDGWIWVTRGAMETEPKGLLLEKAAPRAIKLYNSPGHQRNFLDCVKSRKLTICPVEVGHRSATVGQLGNIAMQTGRTIHWDPDTEQIIGDANASALLGRAMREPWFV